MINEDILTKDINDPLIEDLTADMSTQPTYDDGVLTNRAAKFDIALGDASPGHAEVKKIIESGEEDRLREAVAATANAKKSFMATSLALSTVASGASSDPELVSELAKPEVTIPPAAMEEKFVQNVSDTVLANSQNQRVKDTLIKYSAPLGPELHELEKNTILRNIVHSVSQEYEAINKQRSWMAWGAGEAAQIATFPSWANLIRDPDENAVETSSYLTGTNMKQRADALWAMEPNEFAVALRSELANLSQFNISDAMTFLNVVQGRSNVDAFVEDAMLLSILPVGKLAKGAVQLGKGAGVAGKSVSKMVKRSAAKGESEAAKEAISAVKDISKALDQKHIEPADVAAAAGNIEDAAKMKAVEEIAKSLSDSPMTQKNLGELFKNLPDTFDPKFKFSDAPGYAKKMADELVDRFNFNARMIAQTLRHNASLNTLPPAALDQAFQLAEKQLIESKKGLADYLKGGIVRYDPTTNLGVGQIEATLGTKTGLFTSAEDALQAAEQKFKLKDGTFLVKQEGTGYSIKVYKDIAETGDAAIDDTILTGNKSDHGLGSLNKLLGKELGESIGTMVKTLGSPKVAMSQFQNQERAALAMGTTAMEAAVRQLAAPLAHLYSSSNKKQWKEFQQMLDIGRTTLRDPHDPTSMGLWYKTVGDLGQAYMLHMKRLPSQAEVDAYYTYVLLSDLDYITRSVQSWKEGVKTGHKNYRFKAFTGEGQKIDIDLEGKPVGHLPKGNIDFLDVDANGANRTRNFSKLGQKLRSEFEKEFAEGKLTVIRRRNPEDAVLHPFVGMNRDPISYVVVRDIESSPLRVDKQLNYNPGGHVVYKNSHYVKAPRMVDGQYKGDVTLMAANSQEEADKIATAIQKAIGFYTMKDEASLARHLRQELPWTPEEFKKLFQGGMLKKGMKVAGLRQGQTSADAGVRFADGKFFTDHFGEIDRGQVEPFADAYRSIQDFSQPKSGRLKRTVNEGTESAPLWKLEDAELMNPIQTQVQTMGRVIRNAMYEDYQFQAARSWIEEFGNAKSIKAAGLSYKGRQLSVEELRRNPVFFLKHADISTANPIRAAQAYELRKSILNLLGTPSQTSLSLDYIKHAVTDGKLGAYIPDKAISFLKDPFAYARSVAFHTKLGLFNPIQLFVQANTMVNSFAISPLHAARATPSMMLMLRTSMTSDPDIIRHFGKWSQKMGGLKESEFVDARKWMDHFGLDTIGKEYAWLDDTSDPTLFRSKAGHLFLDKGPMFFNAAERTVRTQSFITSYLDFIAKQPGKAGKLSAQDAKEVLVRSQTMFANMTRDANAWWQRGILSSFTQFYGYQARMIELMVGKQLTKAERARLIFAQMMLYGSAPAAGIWTAIATGDIQAATTALNPFDEDLRTYALKKGHNLDEGTVQGIYHGIVASAIAGMMTHITGEGKLYNVGDRYGVELPAVADQIKQNFDEHDVVPAILITAMGASGSIGADILKSVSPVVSDLMDMAGGGGDTSLLVNDILNATREVSTSNVAHRIAAAHLGMTYLSKNGATVNSDEDPYGETFKALSGLSEVEETDAFVMIAAQRDRKEMIEGIRKRVNQIRGYMKNSGPEEYNQFKRQIEAIVNSYDLLPSEKHRLLAPPSGPDKLELDDAVRQNFEKSFRE
jgi:hypothetical protein